MKLESRDLDRAAYERAFPRFLDGSYRQTASWGQELALLRGARSRLLGFFEAGSQEPVALCELREKDLPLIGGGFSYLGGGPLVRHEGIGLTEAQTVLRTVSRQLAGQAARRGRLLRVAGTLGDPAWNLAQEACLAEAGLLPLEGGRRYRSFRLDLSPSLEELRKGCEQKWRNCLNASERQGLELSWAQDEEAWRSFVDLFDRFVVQKGFGVDLGPDLYERVHRGLPEGQGFRIWTVRHEGRLVAADLSAMHGDTMVYLLGVSDDLGRKTKAAYLLHWDKIRVAKEEGLAAYDLGGTDPESNPGVHRFKRGFGGEELVAPGPCQSPPRGLRARVVQRLMARRG